MIFICYFFQQKENHPSQIKPIMRLCVSLPAFMTPAEWLTPAPAVHGLGPNNKTHMWQDHEWSFHYMDEFWSSVCENYFRGRFFFLSIFVNWPCCITALVTFCELKIKDGHLINILLERRKIRRFMLASKSGFSVWCANFNGILHCLELTYSDI